MSAPLKALARERVGKGAARQLRREGRVPAVIYGDKKAPVSISVHDNEVNRMIHAGGFLSHIITVEVDGTAHKVIPRDYQIEPVKDKLVHVDFLRIGRDTKLTIEVPVHFENEEESPGLKRGGVLNVVRYAVEVICPADAIPESFTIDLTGLEVGDSVHVSTITLPEDVQLTITDRDFTIATIAAPSALRAEEDEEAEAEEAEGEEGEAEAEGEQAEEGEAEE